MNRAVVDEQAARIVSQTIAVSILRAVGEQRPVEQPNDIRRLQGAVVLAAAQLLAVEVCRGIEDARGEIGHHQKLDLDLKEPAGGITGLHVDHGELVVKGLALVVGIEDLDVRNREAQIRGEHRIEEMDKQVAMVVGPEEGLEDTVNLGIDGAVHAESVEYPGRVDKTCRSPQQQTKRPAQDPLARDRCADRAFAVPSGSHRAGEADLRGRCRRHRLHPRSGKRKRSLPCRCAGTFGAF
jgi:hypothetical protein